MHLAFGMADGTVLVRSKMSPQEMLKKEAKQIAVREPRPGTLRFFERRGHADEFGADVVADGLILKRKKMAEYDRLMQKFEYGAALDAVHKFEDPALVVAVYGDLIRRGVLRKALSERTADKLTHLMEFLNKNMVDVRYRGVLLLVFNEILGMLANSINV